MYIGHHRRYVCTQVITGGMDVHRSSQEVWMYIGHHETWMHYAASNTHSPTAASFSLYTSAFL